MNMYKSTETPKNSKNIAILFSGGLDSTYLLWKNLNNGNNVTPYYNEILNNTSKSRIEKQQMAKIIGTLRQQFGEKLQMPRYAAKAELYTSMFSSTLKFKQTPIWLLSTLYMDQEFDEIQIGYVANDDSIPYIKEIKESYNALGWMFLEGKHRPELTFPIYQMPKYEMLHELPLDLKELIFSCENPMIMDERELMNEDSLNFYRGTLMEFFEKDEEYRPLFLKHEPCGECDPCRKILTNYYGQYSQFQPIYKKLKMRETMSDFNDIMRNGSYDEKVREMYNELQTKYDYLTSFKNFTKNEYGGLEKADYKEVALLSDMIGYEMDKDYGKESESIEN